MEKFQFPFQDAEKMYIEGCTINQGNDSFLRNFAKFLYEKQERQHIQLRGFVNLIGHVVLKNMSVAIPFTTQQNTAITELTPEKKDKIDNILKETLAEQQKIFANFEIKLNEVSAIYDAIRELLEKFSKKNPTFSAADLSSNLDQIYFQLKKIKEAIEFDKSKIYYVDIAANITTALRIIESLKKNLSPNQVADSLRFIIDLLNNLKNLPEKIKLILQKEINHESNTLIEQYGTVYELKTDVISAMNATRSNSITHDLLPKLNKFDENRFRIWGLVNLNIAKLQQIKLETRFDFLRKISGALTKLEYILKDIENPTKSMSGIMNQLIDNHKLFTPEENAALKEIQENVLKEARLPKAGIKRLAR